MSESMAAFLAGITLISTGIALIATCVAIAAARSARSNAKKLKAARVARASTPSPTLAPAPMQPAMTPHQQVAS